ncbi:MAG: trypsin-like peptidase domain-containing protein [Pontiellaceae bacterium]|nr:trypsin-like peptidase domain-containing protein [Pontiellaceae bacterium]
MKKQRIGMILVLATAVGWAQADQALMDLLEQVSPPQQEYIRIPASYVLTSLEKSARSSGKSDLAAFSIKNELAGSENKELSINFTGMNMFDAIQAVAKAMGGGADFQEKGVVIVDENLVPQNIDPEPEQPTSTSSKRDKEPLFVFSDISHALVFVDRGDGRSSGFIANIDGVPYFFTNQRNLLNIKTLSFTTMDGKGLKPKTFEYHQTLELLRMQLDPKDLADLTALELYPSVPTADQIIFVYGSDGDRGVAKALSGEVNGIGPEEFVITAKVTQSNAGSPVLNRKGEVLGVVAYSKEQKKSSGGYGIRIPEKGWVKGTLPSFIQQTYALQDLKILTGAIDTLYRYAKGGKSSNEAKSMIAYYGALSNNNGTPTYDLRLESSETTLHQVVRSYVLYSKDTENDDTSKRSNTISEMINDRLYRIFSGAINDILTEIKDTKWKSNVLAEEAREVLTLADELNETIILDNQDRDQ